MTPQKNVRFAPYLMLLLWIMGVIALLVNAPSTGKGQGMWVFTGLVALLVGASSLVTIHRNPTSGAWGAKSPVVLWTMEAFGVLWVLAVFLL